MQNRRKRKYLKRTAITVGVLMLAALLVSAGFLFKCILTAPSISILDARPEGYRSSVLDDEGNVVLTLSEEGSNRVYVALGEVPEDLQHAFVAIEDERFYEHHGVDPKGIARAFVKGIKSGGFSEGASTITQQLLKNNVFEDWTREATFYDRLVRKIQEQYLAVCLEQHVDKGWILDESGNSSNSGYGSGDGSNFGNGSGDGSGSGYGNSAGSGSGSGSRGTFSDWWDSLWGSDSGGSEGSSGTWW